MTVPLRENLQVLRLDKRSPSLVGSYDMTLIREGEGVRLELRRVPRPEKLWEWSTVLDPHLYDISQILTLVMNAIAELDDALSVYRSRIITVRATKGHMAQHDVSLFLEESLKRVQGVQSISDRDETFHDRMRTAARDVDTIHLTTSRIIGAI